MVYVLEITWSSHSKDLASNAGLIDGFEAVLKSVIQKCDSLKGDPKVPSQLSASSSQIAQVCMVD
jgi:hypothetical protein